MPPRSHWGEDGMAGAAESPARSRMKSPASRKARSHKIGSLSKRNEIIRSWRTRHRAAALSRSRGIGSTESAVVVRGGPGKVDGLFPLTATLPPSDGEGGSPCRSALKPFLVGLEARARNINLSETMALGANRLMHRMVSSACDGRLLMRLEVGS